MNSLQLSALINASPDVRRYFQGVYALDSLPSVGVRNSTYICNLDNSHEEGSHWIALYVPSTKDAPVEYFDSYGLAAPKYLEHGLLSESNVRYYLYNKRPIQQLLSATCGQFCLYFIMKRPQVQSMDIVLSIFKDCSLLYNDLLVNRLVESYFAVDLDID